MPVRPASRQIVTVYVATEPTSLHLKQDNLVITKSRRTTKIPLRRISLLQVFGRLTLTTALLKKCLRFKVSLQLFTSGGVFITAITPTTHHYELKRRQYLSPPLPFARQIVRDKLLAQKELLHTLGLDASWPTNDYLVALEKSQKIAEVMGVEGSAAKTYFQTLFQDHDWVARNPRHKLDPLNALLDIGYMKLYYLIESVLTEFGFDPYVGFLHQPYHQRKSLVCDLQEPFRYLVDREVFSLARTGLIRTEDFVLTERGYACRSSASFAHYNGIFMQALTPHTQEIYDYIRNFQQKILGL